MNFDILVALYRNCKRQSTRIIRNHNFTDTECLIANHISADSGCSQDDVAVMLHLDKTTVAKAVKKLEEKGIIRRNQNDDDHRKKELEITENGKAMLADTMEQLRCWFETLFCCMDKEELDRFEALCNKLLDTTDALNVQDER